LKREKTNRRIKNTGNIHRECLQPDSRIAVAVNVMRHRARANGRVRATIYIRNERKITNGDIEIPDGVRPKRAPPHSCITVAGCEADERIITLHGIVVG